MNIFNFHISDPDGQTHTMSIQADNYREAWETVDFLYPETEGYSVIDA